MMITTCNGNATMTISSIFRKLMGTEEERLAHAFKKSFGKNGEAQCVAFVTSPQVHGEFTEGKAEPGYFGGQPYGSAFAMYFVRSALHPHQPEENFRHLVADIDKVSEGLYDGNPTKSIADRLQIYRPDWNVGYDYYPTRQYVESIISPYLLALGVHTSDKQVKQSLFPELIKGQS